MGTITLPLWAAALLALAVILTLWTMSTAIRVLIADRDHWRATANRDTDP